LSARPDIKVVVDSVGNYYDTYKTKEKALALLDQGADVLFETCSGAGIGVLEALDEQSGLCIGSTYNWRKELAQTKYESLANHFLTLGTINCDVAIYDILHKSFSEANIFGKRYSYGAAEGVCVLVDDSEFIAAVGADLQREYTELLSTLPADIPTVYNTDMSEVDALINSVSLPGDTQ